MPNITFALSEETIRRLKEAIRESYGFRKGALSSFVEEAVNANLDRLELQRSSEVFRALKEGKALAEASSLEDLARQLKALGVEPRSVIIVSSKGLPPVARAGFRARKS